MNPVAPVTRMFTGGILCQEGGVVNDKDGGIHDPDEREEPRGGRMDSANGGDITGIR